MTRMLRRIHEAAAFGYTWYFKFSINSSATFQMHTRPRQKRRERKRETAVKNDCGWGIRCKEVLKRKIRIKMFVCFLLTIYESCGPSGKIAIFHLDAAWIERRLTIFINKLNPLISSSIALAKLDQYGWVMAEQIKKNKQTESYKWFIFGMHPWEPTILCGPHEFANPLNRH